MSIRQYLQRCRRHRGHEGVFDARRADRSLEVLCVPLDSGMTDILHWRSAFQAVELRAAGTTLFSCTRGGARLGRIELGELLAFLAAISPSCAAFLRLLLAQFEPIKSRIDVGPPCAEIHRTSHRLAVLAVVSDVDACFCLATDNLANCGA